MAKSTDQFDVYEKWLGIPPGQRPPNHYVLLGLDLYSDEVAAIRRAGDERTKLVRPRVLKHRVMGTQLLNEIALAIVCLCDPARKAAYDEQLLIGSAASSSAPANHTQPQSTSVNQPSLTANRIETTRGKKSFARGSKSKTHGSPAKRESAGDSARRSPASPKHGPATSAVHLASHAKEGASADRGASPLEPLLQDELAPAPAAANAASRDDAAPATEEDFLPFDYVLALGRSLNWRQVAVAAGCVLLLALSWWVQGRPHETAAPRAPSQGPTQGGQTPRKLAPPDGESTITVVREVISPLDSTPDEIPPYGDTLDDHSTPESPEGFPEYVGEKASPQPVFGNPDDARNPTAPDGMPQVGERLQVQGVVIKVVNDGDYTWMMLGRTNNQLVPNLGPDSNVADRVSANLLLVYSARESFADEIADYMSLDDFIVLQASQSSPVGGPPTRLRPDPGSAPVSPAVVDVSGTVANSPKWSTSGYFSDSLMQALPQNRTTPLPRGAFVEPSRSIPLAIVKLESLVQPSLGEQTRVTSQRPRAEQTIDRALVEKRPPLTRLLRSHGREHVESLTGEIVRIADDDHCLVTLGPGSQSVGGGFVPQGAPGNLGDPRAHLFNCDLDISQLPENVRQTLPQWTGLQVAMKVYFDGEFATELSSVRTPSRTSTARPVFHAVELSLAGNASVASSPAGTGAPRGTSPFDAINDPPDGVPRVTISRPPVVRPTPTTFDADTGSYFAVGIVTRDGGFDADVVEGDIASKSWLKDAVFRMGGGSSFRIKFSTYEAAEQEIAKRRQRINRQ